MKKTIEGWDYHEQLGIAFLITDEKTIKITGAVSEYGQDEFALLEGEDSADIVTINADGTLVFDDLIDLRQFNVCNNLLELIHVLNILTTKITGKEYKFDLDQEIAKPNLIEVIGVEYENYSTARIEDPIDLFLNEMAVLKYGKKDKVIKPKKEIFDKVSVTFRFLNQEYSLDQSFCKYVFINGGIEERIWTIEELYSYYFSMSKLIYDLEVKANQDMFLNISEDVVKKLSK